MTPEQFTALVAPYEAHIRSLTVDLFNLRTSAEDAARKIELLTERINELTETADDDSTDDVGAGPALVGDVIDVPDADIADPA